MPFSQRICENLRLKLWYYGKAFSIYFASTNPTAKEVVDGLSDEDGVKTRAYLETLADNEKVLFLKNKSKQVKKNLYRLKTTNQLRFMYFRDGNSFIITHAFIKKDNRIDSEEIKKAERLKTEYYEKKKELGL